MGCGFFLMYRSETPWIGSISNMMVQMIQHLKLETIEVLGSDMAASPRNVVVDYHFLGLRVPHC